MRPNWGSEVCLEEPEPQIKDKYNTPAARARGCRLASLSTAARLLVLEFRHQLGRTSAVAAHRLPEELGTVGA